MELLDQELVVLIKTWQGPNKETALKRLEYLVKTIASLERNIKCPFRWYVADDGSDTWYLDAVNDKFGNRDCSIITSPLGGGNIGLSMNHGLRANFMSTDVVLNWSDDIALNIPLDMETYVDRLRQDERLGYVVLRTTHPTLNLSPLDSMGHAFQEIRLDSPGKFLVGTSLNLMHRRAWNFYGPWPEGLRIDLMQEEMSWRIRRFRDGPKIVIPDELVDAEGCVTYGVHSTWEWRLKHEIEQQRAWYRFRNYAARFEHG